MNKFRFLIIGIGLAGCTYYQNETIQIPKPVVSKPTSTLEASHVASSPNKVSSTYWKTANYLPVAAQDLVTKQVPADDGLFNVSGIYNGLVDFNKGKNSSITMKAAYTDDSLYVLISWRDTVYDASKANWIYNGAADPRKPGSTSGWTSQRSDDSFTLSFDMGSSRRDIWNWSLALSEPLGYAIDMMNTSGTVTNDSGNKTYVRNSVDGTNRGGPMYDWDGNQQSVSRKPAGYTILDPGYYLINKKTFTGDPVAGDAYFQLQCKLCHGSNGDGNTNAVNPVGIALNKQGQFNRWTRVALDAFATSADHEGAVHYPSTETDRANLFARLRGFSGIPGYYLQNPNGSNSDVHSVSNVQLAKIDGYNSKGYSVLLIRALNTGNADDIVFNPTVGQYSFNVSVGDNDDLNRIGLNNQMLTFKPKQ